MGRAAVIRPESCLSYREGAKVSDFKNVSRCSKVKVEIEWEIPHIRMHRVTDLGTNLGKNRGLEDLGKNQGVYWAQ